MKKLKYALMAGVLAVPCAFGLAGCGDTEPEKQDKIMNVSLNPEIEFVLDENDKVVSVNALNDEGNFLIANANFSGKTAEEAVEIVIELSEENGFLVKGSQGTNNIEIAISGETADDLYNSVKNKASQVLSDLGITAQFEKLKLNKEYLQGLVSECMKELTEAEVKAMSEEDLIDLIEESREETKTFYTQELKDLYYQIRANEVRKAEFAKIESVINASGSQSLSALFSVFAGHLDTAQQKMQNLVSTFETQFLNAESTYNQMMQTFVAKKKELLETRLSLGATLTTAEQQALETLEGQVETAIGNLESAKTYAKGLIDGFNNQINQAFNSAEQSFNAMKELVPTVFANINSQIETAVNTAEDQVEAMFKTGGTYEVYVGTNGSNSYWAKVEITKPTSGSNA